MVNGLSISFTALGSWMDDHFFPIVFALIVYFFAFAMVLPTVQEKFNCTKKMDGNLGVAWIVGGVVPIWLCYSTVNMMSLSYIAVFGVVWTIIAAFFIAPKANKIYNSNAIIAEGSKTR